MHGLHFSSDLLFFIISLAYVWSLGLLAGCIAGVGLGMGLKRGRACERRIHTSPPKTIPTTGLGSYKGVIGAVQGWEADDVCGTPLVFFFFSSNDRFISLVSYLTYLALIRDTHSYIQLWCRESGPASLDKHWLGTSTSRIVHRCEYPAAGLVPV